LLHSIDSLINDMCGEKSTLDPEKLPWDAIRSTLCKGVFGGRVTQLPDQDVLDKLVNTVFVPQAYDLNFKLVPELAESPVLPEGSSKDDCVQWIASLAGHTPPTWLGLGVDAEKELEARQAESIRAKVTRIFEKEDHE
jgi:dynein heavy chain 1